MRFEKRPAEGRADVVATREIAPGEELFADYGKRYPPPPPLPYPSPYRSPYCMEGAVVYRPRPRPCPAVRSPAALQRR